MSSYTQRAVRGASIILVISIISSLVSYSLRVFLARNLTPTEYGLFYAVFTVLLFFLFFRDLGLQEALVKYIAEFRVRKQYDTIKTALVSVFVFEIIGTIILSTTFYFLSDYLAIHYFKDPRASLILKVLLLYVLFSIMFKVLKGFFQGFQKMFLFGSFELTKNLIVLSLVVTFFSLGYGLLSPALAYAFVGIILFMIYIGFLLRTFPFFKYKIKNFPAVSKKLFAFALPSFATSVGGKIIGYIDTLFLTYFRTLEEVGIYNAILPSALILFFFAKSVSAVALPLSSELWAKNKKIELAAGLRMFHRYAFFLIIPPVALVFIFAEYLITTFFGPEYAVGYKAFQIILIGVISFVVALTNHSVISGIGNPKTVTKIIFVAAILNILLNLFLIPRYGIEGAALATTCSYFLALIISTYKVSKYTKSVLPWRDWLRLVFPVSTFFLVSYYLKSALHLATLAEILIICIVSTFCYLVLSYLFGVIQIKEIKHYFKLVRSK